MFSISMRTVLFGLAMSFGGQSLAADSALNEPARVVFVCEHGSVKSLIGMVYFNRSAQERGLPYRAVARGTVPEPTVPGPVREGLHAAGFDVRESIQMPEHTGFSGKSATFGIGKAKATTAQSLLEHAVLFQEILDHIKLTAVDPTCEHPEQQVKR